MKEERATRTSLQRSGARQEATDRMDLLRGGANLRLRQIWNKSEKSKRKSGTYLKNPKIENLEQI